MKPTYKFCIALVALLLTAGNVAASAVAPSSPSSPSSPAPRAAELLTQLASGFRAMNGYKVTFTVATGDRTLQGSYSIEGERYTLTLGDAEVFCDGKVRYEVDNRRREVTISGIDRTSRNILNNPAHAFDFLGSEYTSQLLWERGGKAAIRLTPTGKDSSGVITVIVSTARVSPESLTYDFDGEQVAVTVSAIAPLAVPVKSFDRTAFPTYEMIDFR